MSSPSRRAALCLGLLAWVSLTAGIGRAQPANDLFAQAWTITGPAGTTNGSNVGASAETGEPNIFNVAAGESVWYTWTAPADGSYTFTTSGSDFDSLLGIYTGNAVNALTLVGEGVDLISFGTPFSLPVSFIATAGTAYYVQVDGYPFDGLPDGNIVLSWSTNALPSAAGDFLFASQATVPQSLMPLYIASENESSPPLTGRMHAAGESTGQYGARLTVTRLKGATGKVLVDYTVTNTFYTNFFITNTFGTNLITTNSAGFYTNIFTTNILITALYQNNEYGQWVYLPGLYTLTTIIGSNINGVIGRGITNYAPTNVPPVFTCDNSSISNSITTTDTPPVTITFLTNVFCITTNLTNIVASATPFRDYVPTSGQLIFYDYQMSADIQVAVIASASRRFPILNHVLIASITNVALDPLESATIPPPTASTAGTNAMLNILSQVAMIVPFEINPNSGPSGTGTGVAGTNVFNFERTTIRCTENVNGFGVARVYVLRNSLDYSQATSVDYRIDFFHPYTDENNTFMNPTDWEIPLQAASDYAGVVTRTPTGTYSDNIHFTTVSGTLNWGANDGLPKLIEIPITDDNVVQFNEDLLLQLRLPGPKYPNAGSERSLGYVQTCNLTILFDDQPAGAVDNSYNPENDANTHPAYNLHPGPNSAVYAIAIQGDGKAIIGGDFTDYNGIGVVNNQANIYRLARINTDGSLDQTFNPGNGADQAVNALAIDASGNVVLAGAFTSIDGITRNRIARVDATGALDNTFGLNQQGADGIVWTIGIDASSGAILMAGNFTNVNTLPRHYIARLLPDGTLDPSFDPGPGPDGPILTTSVQSDGAIIIGGDFTHVDGVSLNHIARLNANGSLDGSFAPGAGFDGEVDCLALQPDGKVVVGGAFHSFNAYTRNGLTRLDAFGNLDQSFLTGSGADDSVYSVLLQPDQTILLSGIFKTFNQTRRVGIARVFGDGTVDTSFMDTAYNQFAGVVNHYWDPAVEAPNFISAMGLQPDGNILIAGSFLREGGGGARDTIGNRQNFTRLIGGVTPGPGNIGLVYPNYSANQTDETLFINMSRTNGHLGPAAVTVKPITYPTNNGTAGIAIEGQDFTFDSATYGTPTWIVTYPGITWHLGDGSFGQNNGFGPTVDPTTIVSYPQNDVYISLIDNTNVAGNRQLTLELDNPTDNDQFLLGGQKIPLGVALGAASAPMTIVDPHTLHGVLGFSSPTYRSSETTNAIITVTRTNGITGTVTVDFQTLNGTATNLIHYRTNWTRLTFNGGDTVKSVVVTNLNETIKEGDHTVNLRLLNPSGGATLGLSNAVLTLIDDDVTGGYVEFNSPTYFTNENAGFAYVTLNRNGSSAGTLSVQFSTSDGTATNGVDYLGMTITNTWNNGDITPRIIAIPLLDDGVVETNNLTINLQLRSATLNGTNDPAALIGTINAILSITNSDFRGRVAFSTTTYNVNENGGPGYITIVRMGGSAESITVNFATLPGTSTPGIDFYPTNGTLLFGPGEVSKTFTVPIIDNGSPSHFVTLVLSNAAPPEALGFPSTAILNIVENTSEPPGSLDTLEDPSAGVNDVVYALALQADGRLLVAGDFTMANGLERNRVARLNTDGSLDQTFSSTSPLAGANASVLAIVCQTDGRIVLGGSFTNVNNVRHNFVARVAANGAVDTTFNPVSAGPNNPVFAVAETFTGSTRKLLVGGEFTSINSVSRNFIARLNDDGSLDQGFQVGLGANGNVFAIGVQPDGKAIIGGDFTAVGQVTRHHVARLNTDGSVDLSFDPGAGASDSVRSIAVQLDGRIVIGGLFTNVNRTALNHLARLTDRGAVDDTFTPGLGFNDVVTTIAIQPDTRIVLGGQFTLCNGVTRHRLTRLNNDGTLDTMINFGDGADSFVAAVVIQTNGMINLGGGFTHYDDQPRQHLARIYGGTIGGAGTLEFTSGNYQVLETATNATLTVRRRGGTSGVMSNDVYVPNISVIFATDPRDPTTAVLGTNYLGVTNTLIFPPGEVFQNVTIPVIHDFAITPDLVVSNYLWNPQPAVPGGPAIGNQPSALLTIGNVDSGVSFEKAAYFFTEDSGFATIAVLRTGSSNGVMSVDFLTTTNGTAIAFTNYVPMATNLTFADGQVSNLVQITLIHDTAAQGDRTVILQLSNAVGSLLLNPSQSILTIVDVDHLPGQLLFSQTNYVVSEGAGFLPVTILRTNGQSGTVQVNFSTVGGTALPGFKYLTTNGVATFGPGQTSYTFTVPILEENQVEGNQTFSLVLSNATLGATLLGPTNVPVTIIDDDVGISFVSPVYVVPETSGNVSLALYRQNGTNGVTTVHYSTTNITAQAGVNYVGITNGIITFNPGDVFKSLVIGVLHDAQVTGDVSFGVNLFNPSAPAQLGTPSSATVVLLDTEVGLSFASTNLVAVTNADLSVTTNASFGALKSSGTNLLITVLRSNVNNGTVGVSFATADGTGLAGVDYVANSGALTFSNGIAFQTLSVQVISNRLIEGDRTFSVYLTNATPTNVAFLLTPYTATVTITDDVAGLSFSSPSYTANENGQKATITVFRSNYTNNAVSVDFSTADDTGHAGVNYFPTNGTLVFNNGDTAKTFDVALIDDHLIDGGHTVTLNLSNPVGNAVIVNPTNATLLIAETDGSLIIPAGVALTSESGPVDGVIEPGEMVTLLFALRNANGTNTASLIATLLATTNGISNPSGPQSYGVLTAHGPSASRPFTFTANGTNGQTITATLQLHDGSTVLSNADFSFTLGKMPASYSNNSAIVINDFSSATPYPSAINVSNLNGLVTQVTVTLTNVNHTNPRDIDALLVSPTGQKTYLMAHCGGILAINNTTLTFDDTTPTPLPQSTQIASGTYHPTSYALGPPAFPAPSAPFPTNATAPPYVTNLSVFNNTSPNGAWALYVVDDQPLFSGSIANGWILNLTLTGPVPGAADLALGMIASALTNVATSNLTYTLVVTNYGPSSATNVVVTDFLPTGTLLVSTNASQGSVTNVSGQVTWKVSSLVKDATATLTLVVQPTLSGLITNSATVSTDTSDPNSDDNSASVVTTIVGATADLALGLTDSPDPVTIGVNLTYTITVTNLGVGTAPGVTVIDTLPPTVNFVSASPSNWSTNTVAGHLVVTFLNLGNLASNQQVTAMIVVTPTAPGTLTDSATCSSGVTDPHKANNNASVKTIVEAVPLTVTHVVGGLAISWPVSSGNYVLESTTNLHPPSVWTPVTDAVSSLVGGQMTVIVPIGPGNRFFRLRLSTVPMVPLSYSRSGANLTLVWAVNPWNLNLESATSLHAPVLWTPVATPQPQVANGQNTVTLTIGGGNKFFRLHGTTP